MLEFKAQIIEFSARIVQTLMLVHEPLIEKKKEIEKWLKNQKEMVEETIKIKKQEQKKKKESLFAGLRSSKTVPRENMDKLQQILRFESSLQNPMIQAFEFKAIQPPEYITNLLNQLKGREIKVDYHEIRGPFITSNFTFKKKQQLMKIKSEDTQLKFTRIGPEYVQKFQRILIQEIFGRLFRKQGSLAIVLQIQSSKKSQSPTYFFVQDLKHIPKKTIGLEHLSVNKQTYQISDDENHYKINQEDFLQIIISEFMTLPLETFIPQFYCYEKNNQILLYRHEGKIDLPGSQKELIMQHAGLRNPLLFFKQYFKEYEIETSSITKIIFHPRIYQDYFDSLQMIFDLQKEDFEVLTQKHYRVPSILFNYEAILTISEIFHKILILQKWLEQVVRPIKPCIKIYELVNEIWPIFNAINVKAENLTQYRAYFQKLQIFNYISSFIHKKSLSGYLDAYKKLNIDILNEEYLKQDKQCFNSSYLLEAIISDLNIESYTVMEAIYLIQFYTQNLKKLVNKIEDKWKNLKFWRKISEKLNQEFLNTDSLDINIVFTPYYILIDPIRENFKNWFDPIKTTVESSLNISKLKEFIEYIGVNVEFIDTRQKIYLQLFEKSIIYNKLKFAKIILEQDVGKFNLECLFKLRSSQQENSLKEEIMKQIEQKYPQKFRRYRWEQIFKIFLKQKPNQINSIPIKVFEFGPCQLSQQIFNQIFKQSNNLYEIENKNVVKGDYMYNLKNDFTKLKTQEFQLYIERVERPGIDFFFRVLLQKLQAFFLKPHTTYFAIHDTILQFTQCLSKADSISKLNKMYKEKYIMEMIDKKILSQAIIISLLIYPIEISFDDIIYKPSAHNKDIFNIYIKSFESYSSIFFVKENSEKKLLKVKNALFLLSVMEQNIDNDIMQKYANMNILEKIREVFEELQNFNDEIKKMYNKNIEISSSKFKYLVPFLGVPFEKDFILEFTERFFLVSSTFKKILKSKTKFLSHLQLFEKINHPGAQLYKEILNTTKLFEERWDLLLKYEKKGKLFVETSLLDFFSAYDNQEEIHNSIQKGNKYFPLELDNLNFVGSSQSLLKLKQQEQKYQIFQYSSDNINKLCEVLIKCKPQHFQFFMKYLDFNQYSPQESLFEIFKKQTNRYILNPKKFKAPTMFHLINCTILKEKSLSSFTYERVIELTLDGCERILESDLANISEKANCLSYLKLSNISTLQCFAAKKTSIITQQQPIVFKLLKTLIINSCSQLNYLDIRCSELVNLQIQNNRKLENIYVVSDHFKNINCKANPVLKVENLSIYIITGINVLVDEITSHGEIGKIIHQHEGIMNLKYSRIVCRLFAYLLNRFDDAQVRNNILVTIFKIKLLDENLTNEIFTIFSTILTRYITTNFKLTAKLEEELLKNLIKCFTKNIKIEEINLCDFEISSKKLDSKTVEKFINSLKEIAKSKKITYKTLVLEKDINENVLHLFAEACKHINFKQTTDLIMEVKDSFEDVYLDILQIMCNCESLYRLNLLIKNSSVTVNFMKRLLGICYQKLHCIEYSDCLVQSHLQLINQEQGQKCDKCKNMVIRATTFLTFDFLFQYRNIITLEIYDCNITNFIDFIEILSELKDLKILTLQKILKEDSVINEFIKRLALLKIESLNLVQNFFQNESLLLFNDIIHRSYIKELTLNKFLKDKGVYDFRNFLKKCRVLKKLEIELETQKHVKDFMESVSDNQSILQIHLNYKHDLEFFVFDRLVTNKCLEELHITQNIKPIWLVNHLNQNRTNKILNQSKFFSSEINKKSSILVEDCSTRNRYDQFKIGLSLDGGGMRGLILAAQLHYLAAEVKKPLHKIFDCIGGTSIGGILSLGITGTHDNKHPICNTSQLINIFQVHGKEIFYKSQVQAIINLYQTKYSKNGIEKVLNKYFKNCQLSQVLDETSVIVTSVHRKNNQVQIFRSKEAKLDQEYNFYMRDVGRATSAAPTYFPSAEIKNIKASKQYSLIDGGIGLNNPSKLIIEELKKSALNFGAEENYFLLSLGTGRIVSENSVPKNAGLKDLAPIIDAFSEAQNYFIENEMINLYQGKYLRVSPELTIPKKDSELDNSSAEVLAKYKSAGFHAAREYFSTLNRFGTYKDRSLVEWLSENTARKSDV